MTSLLCINPYSRSGDMDCERFVDRLAELGPVVVRRLTDDLDLEQLIRHHDPKFDRIVLGGGDGTLNRALPALVKCQIPMGVIPLGTANDFARSLSLPADPEQALDAVLAGHTKRIGLGKANGHLFLNAAGIGLGPELTRRLDHERKQRLGVLAYLSSLIEVIGRRRNRWAEMNVDGVSRRLKFMQITIANGVHYGGGMTIAQDAQLDDGMLNVLCLEPQSPAQLLGKAVTLRWGADRRVRQDKMHLFQASDLIVKTRFPMDVSLDGELVTRTPLRCRSIADALDVFVPPAEAEQSAESAEAVAAGELDSVARNCAVAS